MPHEPVIAMQYPVSPGDQVLDGKPLTSSSLNNIAFHPFCIIADRLELMQISERIFRLQGSIQHYEWGGTRFIAELIGANNDQAKPVAEYWLGAHPKSPSYISIDGSELRLDEWIDQHRSQVLGEQVMNEFNGLPYLLKVQDVDKMLSIQVHPSKEEAEKGFDFEEKTGVPIDAPHRNYKDRNHKPELLSALTPFWLLHGFKTSAGILKTLHETPELIFLIPYFNDLGHEGLYRYIMELPQFEVNNRLTPLRKRVNELYADDSFDPQHEDYWAFRAFRDYSIDGLIDRGIFSIYLFNIVNLEPGTSLFQYAGVPHAYLKGQCMEIMSNSDNVLRGGLTPKHIDVPELLKHIRFEGILPKVIQGLKNDAGEEVFITPVKDFQLSRIELTSSVSLNSQSMEILFVYDGKLSIESKHSAVKASRGEAFVVPANTLYRLAGSDAIIYRAAVPVSQ
jgi:mannose-6-phosphate isomerase